jgi:hypothetical protein
LVDSGRISYAAPPTHRFYFTGGKRWLTRMARNDTCGMMLFIGRLTTGRDVQRDPGILYERYG